MIKSVPSTGEIPVLSEKLFSSGLAMEEILPKPRAEFIEIAEKDLGKAALKEIMGLRYQNSVRDNVKRLIELMNRLGADKPDILSTDLVDVEDEEHLPEDTQAVVFQLAKEEDGQTLTVVTAKTENGMIVDGEQFIFHQPGSNKPLKLGLSPLGAEVNLDDLRSIEEISVPELAAISVYTEKFGDGLEAAIESGSVEASQQKLF